MPHPVQVDDWVLIQGELVDRVYTFTREDESPFVLTGKILQCHFRRYPDGIEILHDATLTILPTGDQNQLRLTILPSHTMLLSGVMVYDIRAAQPSNLDAIRLVQGTVPVSLAVTH